MKLKKILAIMMAAAMATAMTACGGNSDSGSESSTEENASSESTESSGQTYTIGICQQMEHDALDQATQGFMDACTELFGEGNVEFDQQNAQGEQAMCSTIINNFVSSDVDLILANATLRCRQQLRPQRTSRSWELPLPIMPQLLESTTGQELPESMYPEPATWHLLISRKICCRIAADTQKVGILYFPQNLTLSTRRSFLKKPWMRMVLHMKNIPLQIPTRSRQW